MNETQIESTSKSQEIPFLEALLFEENPSLEIDSVVGNLALSEAETKGELYKKIQETIN